MVIGGESGASLAAGCCLSYRINGARFWSGQPWSDIPCRDDARAGGGSRDRYRRGAHCSIHYGVAGAEGYREIRIANKHLREVAKVRGVRLQVLRAGEWLSWPGLADGPTR